MRFYVNVCVCLGVKCRQSWLTLDASSDQMIMNCKKKMGFFFYVFYVLLLLWGN
jgi:hypothetical protein